MDLDMLNLNYCKSYGCIFSDWSFQWVDINVSNIMFWLWLHVIGYRESSVHLCTSYALLGGWLHGSSVTEWFLQHKNTVKDVVMNHTRQRNHVTLYIERYIRVKYSWDFLGHKINVANPITWSDHLIRQLGLPWNILYEKLLPLWNNVLPHSLWCYINTGLGGNAMPV